MINNIDKPMGKKQSGKITESVILYMQLKFKEMWKNCKSYL